MYVIVFLMCDVILLCFLSCSWVSGGGDGERRGGRGGREGAFVPGGIHRGSAHNSGLHLARCAIRLLPACQLILPVLEQTCDVV